MDYMPRVPNWVSENQRGIEYVVVVLLLIVAVALIFSDNMESDEHQKCKDLTVSRQVNFNGYAEGIIQETIDIDATQDAESCKKIGTIPKNSLISDIILRPLGKIETAAGGNLFIKIGNVDKGGEFLQQDNGHILAGSATLSHPFTYYYVKDGNGTTFANNVLGNHSLRPIAGNDDNGTITGADRGNFASGSLEVKTNSKNIFVTVVPTAEDLVSSDKLEVTFKYITFPYQMK